MHVFFKIEALGCATNFKDQFLTRISLNVRSTLKVKSDVGVKQESKNECVHVSIAIHVLVCRESLRKYKHILEKETNQVLKHQST